ncbi:hypothetical protein J437_LFUL005479 [Ladona fulva]|uniref:Mediator of RNA polymerase II transcription subunit 13 n=1 Tax=Ladona fulva TaxID=123851 RepID=A0A8K0JYH8_LADFU|nr:hypothetical protein J437_LFUL005479 [Ladona fulva]
MQTDLCGIKWRKLLYAGDSPPASSSGFPGSTPVAQPQADPLEDPVLASFSKCLAADILCVWRRVPTPNGHRGGGGLNSSGFFSSLDPGSVAALTNFQRPLQQQGLSSCNSTSDPPLALHAAKELWIFWYGEEPDLSGLVSPQLLATVRKKEAGGGFVL